MVLLSSNGIGLLLLVVCLYYVGCLVGFALRFPSSGISFFWPPTAVLTAVLLLTPPRTWGFSLAGALIAHTIAHTQRGIPITASSVQFLANAVQAGIAAWTTHWFGAGRRLLGDLRGIAASIGSASTVAPAVASLIPAYVYVGMGWAPDVWQAWRARTVSNAIAALTLLPLILVICGHLWPRPSLPSARRLGEMFLLLLGLIATDLIAARTTTSAADAFFWLYAQMPFLLWAVVRFGVPGLSCALLCTTLLTISSALRGQHLFAGAAPADAVVTVQLFIAMTAVPLMLMAGLLEENRTERRASHELQQEHEAVLRAIPDMMFVLTRDGVYVRHYARSVSELLVPPDSFIGKNMRDVLPTEVADMFAGAFEHTTPDTPAVGEYTLVMNGEPRRYEARLIGVERDRVLTIVRDITERARAEQALRESQQRYALATAAGGVGVWDVNIATGELYVEAGLKRLLGYAEHELGSQALDWAGLVHPADLEEVVSGAIAAFTGTSSGFEAEHRVVHKDGSIRWFVTKGEISERVDGRAIRMTGTYTDITQRNQAERALRQANAALTRMARITALGELTASIAHELNQPLCAIVANATACLRWLDTPTPRTDIRGALNDVVQDSHRASEIVRRTRELFTNRPVRKRPLDLNDAVRDVLELAAARLQRSDIALEVQLDDDLPLVNADDVQIQQVLLNVVLNAVDAMRSIKDRPRVVRVESRRGNALACVSVRDEGEGFRPNEIERVFDPFYTTKPGGMGIGLAVSRAIIQSHGGSLWAEANDAGGATFSFTIPALDGQP